MLSQMNLKARDTIHLTTFSCLKRRRLVWAIQPVFLQINGERREFLLVPLPPEGGCLCWLQVTGADGMCGVRMASASWERLYSLFTQMGSLNIAYFAYLGGIY